MDSPLWVVVNPARAGMIPSMLTRPVSTPRKPRASGDDPSTLDATRTEDLRKPRASGDDPTIPPLRPGPDG